MSAPDRVSVTLPVTILFKGGVEEQEVRWIYEPAQPFIVTMDCSTSADRNVWYFDREMLWQAITKKQGAGPIGHGDVQITVTDKHVHLRLANESEAAMLTFTRTALRIYLRATCAAVRIGEEHLHYDINAEIRKLIPGHDADDTCADAGGGEATPMD